MTAFEVWAPAAGQVELVLDGAALPMVAAEHGWWRIEAPAAPSARYGFAVDGGPVRPDPRSRSQPDGVHALSALDDDRFEWTDDRWSWRPLAGSVLYELHVGTFTPAGTFDAAIERLPHLVDLGVDAVEVMPVAAFSGDRGWGYDGVGLYAVHAAYGGPDGLRRFVDACHGHGLGVLLDVVYNHFGPEGNYLATFGPYVTDRRTTIWGSALNVDGPGSDVVRQFVIDNALMWLEDFHLDGLRLDAVHAIEDASALHVLEQLATEVEALEARTGRHAVLIAESDRNDPRYVRSRDAGGYGLDAAWADDWHHAVHAALTGERGGYYEDFGGIDELVKALRQAWVYDGTRSPHRDRAHGRPPEGLHGGRFVVSVQNHDQVGNRAAGDRLSSCVDLDRLRIAAALLLTSPFTPLLFQGEEWGAATPFAYFTGHEDPELGRAVSEGRRAEFARFGWDPATVLDPQDPVTFERSKLDWTELDGDGHAELLAWYRELIALRHAHPDLADPRLDRIEVAVAAGTEVLQIRRGRVHLAVDLGSTGHELRFEHAVRPLLTSPGTEVAGPVVRLAPGGVAIVELGDA